MILIFLNIIQVYMVIKNEQIKKAISFEKKNKVFAKDAKSAAKVYENATAEEMGMSILWGYVSSLCEVSKDLAVNAELDLTYSTMLNFMKAVGGVFASVSNPLAGNAEKTIAEIIEKTIASYLMLLAINDDKANIFFSRDIGTSAAELYSPVKWSGIKIEIGNMLWKSDFLDAIHGTATVKGNELIVRTDKIVRAYQQLTGKNLADFGMEDMTVSVG